MPPKKKKGKKKKEVEPITDARTLRMIGEYLEGTTLKLTLCYEVENGPIRTSVVLSDLDCVHHLFRELWRWLDCEWGKEYIFISTLPTSDQNSFTLGFDGGKGLTDLGIKNVDCLVFVESNKRTLGEYTKKRMRVQLDALNMKLSDQKAELLLAKKDDKHADDIAALEENIKYFDGEVDKYRAYSNDHKKAIADLYTFEIGEKLAPTTAGKGKKPFSELPIEIKQELENEKKEGLDILINNRNIIAAQKAKAAGGGKKGKKGKKKK